MRILETQHPLPHPLALVLNYPCLDFNFTSWMSPENLQVLRSEQSSGRIDGLVEQKDHLRGVSPLSMVRKRQSIRRRRSWRDAIRNLTSRSRDDGGMLIGRGRASISARHAQDSAESMDDTTDTDEEEESDFPATSSGSGSRSGSGVARAEEDLPLTARVRFNPQVHQVPVDSRHRHHHGRANGGGYTGAHIDLGEVDPANGREDGVLGQGSTGVPVGTRLTMTSRSGYFQDRIISPSMVRTSKNILLRP